MSKAIKNGDIRFSDGIIYFPKGNRIHTALLPKLLQKAQTDEKCAKSKLESSKDFIDKITSEQKVLQNEIDRDKKILGPIRSELVELKFQQSMTLKPDEYGSDTESFLYDPNWLDSCRIDYNIEKLDLEYNNICKEFFIYHFMAKSLQSIVALQSEIVSILTNNLSNILKPTQVEEGKNPSEKATRDTVSLLESIIVAQANQKLKSLEEYYYAPRSYYDNLVDSLYMKDIIKTIKCASESFFYNKDAESLKLELRNSILLNNVDIVCQENITRLSNILNMPISDMLNKVKLKLKPLEEALFHGLAKYSQLQENMYKHNVIINEARFEIERAQSEQRALKHLIEKLDEEEKNPKSFEEDDKLLPPEEIPPLKKLKTLEEGQTTLLYLTDDDNTEDVTYAGDTPPTFEDW